MKTPKTLYNKIFDNHIVDKKEENLFLLYIDRHLVHEVTSPQAFEGLRLKKKKVRCPNRTLAVVDHNVPTTTDRYQSIKNPQSKIQVDTLEKNTREFGIKYFSETDIRQGIVHVVGPEQGFTLPGMTIVCGDSHTSTHGAFGSLSYGIGTSEVEHVLATQTLMQKKSKNMLVQIDGKLSFGVTAKDVALEIIRTIGTSGGTGYIIEYSGETIKNFSMEERMTICNMSIEAGARSGLIAPDEKTFSYIKNRPYSPRGSELDNAILYWKSLRSDIGVIYDRTIRINVSKLIPTVTWGSSPEDAIPITGVVPNPNDFKDESIKLTKQRAIEYMGLYPGMKLLNLPIDRVFIGSCTNSRIEDLRSAASIIKGRHVSKDVSAIVVPGSGLVKIQAESEGLDKIFIEAGFEWREPGCSMCLGMNDDRLNPRERCVSTSNRNFEDRQGYRGRTHLTSPIMASAAAIAGHFVDVRYWK